MTSIYSPLIAADHEWVNSCNGSDVHVFAEFDGQPRIDNWHAIKVKRVRADTRHGFKYSDFPWLGGDVLVMRRPAVEALKDMLEAHGEILPLATEDAVELFAFNCPMIDALDEALSSIIRFPVSNRIMFVQKPVFIQSVIEKVDLFRPRYRASPTYVSERFVDRVKSAGLKGLDFTEVWTSSSS
jgi:hypothetical protein